MKKGILKGILKGVLVAIVICGALALIWMNVKATEGTVFVVHKVYDGVRPEFDLCRPSERWCDQRVRAICNDPNLLAPYVGQKCLLLGWTFDCGDGFQPLGFLYDYSGSFVFMPILGK